MDRQTTTWELVNTRLDAFLKDVEVEGEWNYPPAHRVAAWNWAQRMLCYHTPRTRSTTLVIDSDGRSAILPSDFLGMWRVYDAETERWLRRMPMQIESGIRYQDAEMGQWWVWGGCLYLEMTKTVGSTDLTMYYYAYYPEIVIEELDGDTFHVESKILTPPWAELALCHLTAATLLVPGSLEAARLRQWNIRIDSGTPLQNSRAMQAREHLWWWKALLGVVKPLDWGAS